jgi:hypothetical protein
MLDVYKGPHTLRLGEFIEHLVALRVSSARTYYMGEPGGSPNAVPGNFRGPISARIEFECSFPKLIGAFAVKPMRRDDPRDGRLPAA